MKIAKAVIENFRQIEKLELNFTDSIDRVRNVTLIAGPNASGKTTILDALATCVGVNTDLSFARPDFRFSPRTIVRRGAVFARVSCEVRFSKEEIEANRQLLELSEENAYIPDFETVKVTWRYPDPQHKMGLTVTEPKSAWKLFKGRAKAARLLSTGRLVVNDAKPWSWFEKVGGVFTFDQQRTGLSKTIRQDISSIIRGGDIDSGLGDNRKSSDPREILLAKAIESTIDAVNPNQQNDFELIQARYAEICTPRRLVGARRDEIGDLDIFFSDGQGNEYRYDGLSSGEQMLLLFIIKMVTDHIHKSILLIDEVELHQHPTWQLKLLNLLPKIGKDNQIIATTHSRYLRDTLPRDAIIDLGELEVKN
jgi:predicted ATPase